VCAGNAEKTPINLKEEKGGGQVDVTIVDKRGTWCLNSDKGPTLKDVASQKNGSKGMALKRSVGKDLSKFSRRGF